MTARKTTPKRVLVLGGGGFLGAPLIDVLLARGMGASSFGRRVSTRHPELSIVGDVRSADDVTAAAGGHDAIIHLIAEFRDDAKPASLYEEVNVGGTRAVIAAAETAGVERIVFTSTVALYGLDKSDAAEDSTPAPFNEYGRTKLAAEKLLRSWAEASPGRSLVIVRPSVVFGEGSRGNVYKFACQVTSRSFVMIGTGGNRKSMSYVGNIVEFLADCLGADVGVTTVNYSDKPDLTTRELADAIRSAAGLPPLGRMRLPLFLGLAAGNILDTVAAVTGRRFAVSATGIRKFAAETTVNTDRLAAPGYTPRYTLGTAIRRTIAADFTTKQESKR